MDKKIRANFFAACKDANKTGVCEYTVEGDTPEEVVEELHKHEQEKHAQHYDAMKPEEQEALQKEFRKIVQKQAVPELRKPI